KSRQCLSACQASVTALCLGFPTRSMGKLSAPASRHLAELQFPPRLCMTSFVPISPATRSPDGSNAAPSCHVRIPAKYSNGNSAIHTGRLSIDRFETCKRRPPATDPDSLYGAPLHQSYAALQFVARVLRH